MLYRHAHALLEGTTENAESVGRTFRVVPADGDAPDAQQSFVFWSTLVPRGEVPGKPDASDAAAEKAPEPGIAQLVLEVSADAEHWVALDPHLAPQVAQVVRVPFLLPFVRARVLTRGLAVWARAVLLGASPFALHPVVRRAGFPAVRGTEPHVSVDSQHAGVRDSRSWGMPGQPTEGRAEAAPRPESTEVVVVGRSG